MGGKIDANNNKVVENSDLQNDKLVVYLDPETLIKGESKFQTPHTNRAMSWLKRASLRTKTRAFAIGISTLPVLIVGTIAWNLVSYSVTKEIINAKQYQAVLIADNINQFMQRGYEDIQILSQQTFFKNLNLDQSTNRQQIQKQLNDYLNILNKYERVTVLDRNGDTIVDSQGRSILNQKNEEYFQAVLQTDKPYISQPIIFTNTKDSQIYFAAPIKDSVTDKTTYIIRAIMPLKSLESAIKLSPATKINYTLIAASGKIFLSGQNNQFAKNVAQEIPQWLQLQGKNQVTTRIFFDQKDREGKLITYVPLPSVEGLPELKWKLFLSTDTAIAFATQRQLLLILQIGTMVIALLVGAIATFLANHLMHPIVAAIMTVKKLGEGNLDTRIAIDGEDELATLGFSINQMAEQLQDLLGKQTAEKEQLQQQLQQLIAPIEGAKRGDLTVRAEETSGAIGIFADFFNSIMISLQEIVIKVKTTATEVNTAIAKNSQIIEQLSVKALQQAQKISHTLNSVDQMQLSIQAVADSAMQAAVVARTASHTAETGGEAMDLTVESNLSLRETMGETAKKIKRLGESLQEISRVVALINHIAMQTNLLAINTSIEAARDDGGNQALALIAEEVAIFAAQSREASSEIEKIVANIQVETSEVAKAMEWGTIQAIEETRLVQNSKQSFRQIIDVCRQIDELVQSISAATVSQVQTSKEVSHLMTEINQVSEMTSNLSDQVSTSLQKTVDISQELQESVGFFKVN
ncbi:MAG: methyl-accepting chemotaxis protein [Fischerella sp.]|nr:methyl-accepting chemotaxis protein [Fischerella sp.]